MKKEKTPKKGGPAVSLTLLAALVFLAYRRALGAGFYLDDLSNILGNHALVLRGFSPAELYRAAFEGASPNRPLVSLAFAFERRLFGLDPLPFHLTNIFIHLLASIGVWSLAGEILARRGKTGYAPLLLAALFAAHPVQVQAVTYTVQRMTSLSGAFFLWGLYFYVRARRTNRTFRAAAAVSALLILALGCKETATLLVPAALLVDFTLLTGNFREKTACLPILALPALLTVLAALWYTGCFSPGSGPVEFLERSLPPSSFTIPERFLVGFRVLVFYVSLILVPLPGRLALEHDFLPPVHLGPSILSLVLTVLAAVYALRYFRKRPLTACSIGWFLLLLLPETFLVYPLAPAYEHRLYLPVLALLTPLALLLCKLGRRGLWAGAGLVLLLAGLTDIRNLAWSDAVTLWSDTVNKSPRLARPRNNLGWALNGAGRLDEALRQLEEAVRLDPAMADAYHNRGVVLYKWNRKKEAEAMYRKAISIDPGHAKAREDLAIALFDSGRTDEAIGELEEALRLTPYDAGMRYNLAMALHRLGRLGAARRAYRQALRLDPDHAKALLNLGGLLLGEGRCAEAAGLFERAIIKDPAARAGLARSETCLGSEREKPGR